MEEKDTLSWFQSFPQSEEYKKFKASPVAYFSAEYALAPYIPTYAGGLGVLAGDTVREAAERNFPLIAIGLMYSKAQYDLTEDSVAYVPKESDGFSVARNENGERILISVPIYHEKIFAEAWKYTNKNESTAPIYFLNTNIPENDPSSRKITERLYVDDRETRLKQEILLGIGGHRLIHALGIHPSVFHLNEGHSAFLALELVHHEMIHQRVDFFTACDYARKHIIFTNHTLVAAGNEQFGADVVSAMIAKYAEEMQVAVSDIVSLGLLPDSNIFSMTSLSFRLSRKASAVSKLHAKKAHEIWKDNPMEEVTNGIYIPLWDKTKNTSQISGVHKDNKKNLLSFIKEKTEKEWAENSFIIGWARRIVPYKRPLELFSDIEGLQKLIKNSPVPIKIVFSGPTRNGEQGNEMVQRLRETIEEHFGDSAVFLPHYNLDIASKMVSGADIWLNTPVVGTEACGTSGMKAALNGTLALSTADGWIAEISPSDVGFIVDDPNLSEKIITKIEKEIIPLYLFSDFEVGTDSPWVSKMKKARALILKQFGTDRMLREYIEKLYIPTLAEKHKHLYE